MVRELLGAIRLRLGPIEVGPLPRTQADPATALHALLELPVTVAQRTGERSLVCLDEFQEVLAVPGLDGLLRSHLQHHGEQVSYAFVGSEPSLLRELFYERSRPLYGQAHPVRLERIDPELLAQAITQRFAGTGRTAGEAAALIAELGDGHPQRTMLLAWHLWELTPAATIADAGTARRAAEQAVHVRRHELEAVERSFTANERRVAVALAHGLSPTGTRAQRATGLATGSAGQTALRALAQRGEIEQDERGGWRLIDPLLAAYLRARHADAANEPGSASRGQRRAQRRGRREPPGHGHRPPR